MNARAAGVSLNIVMMSPSPTTDDGASLMVGNGRRRSPDGLERGLDCAGHEVASITIAAFGLSERTLPTEVGKSS